MKVRIAATFAARARGLLGRPRSWLGEGGLLVIVPCSSVHTFGMRERIDVAFAAPDGRILKVARGVSPNRVLSSRGAVAAIERFSPREMQADSAVSWFAEGDAVSLEGA